MKTQCLSLDRISTLPDNIIEKILTLVPIRDAVRTSVLSTKWRYSWRGMPKLEFTDNMIKVPSHDGHGSVQLKKYKLVNAIFHVLLFHNGPTILEFYISVGEFQMVSELDLIIGCLSKLNNVKELKFVVRGGCYKLPVSFYSVQGLESIYLYNCSLEPPLTFNGFSRLKKIIINHNGVVSTQMSRLLSKSPLLEFICLRGNVERSNFTGGNKFTFVDLFQCVPLIQTLVITKCYMKSLSTGGMPHKLPTSLVNLKYLIFEVCLMEHDEISSVLCMIRSSPLLRMITFLMNDNEKLRVRQTPVNFLDLERYSELKLDHLQTLDIRRFSNLPLEMKFVKLIMAKSPVLQKVKLELNDSVSTDEELNMLKALVLLPIPRASPSAKLIITRPKST